MTSASDLFLDPVFTVGQQVVCRNASGYPFLSEGKTYTVVAYDPRSFDRSTGFCWPAYVSVIGDDSRRSVCHASRFYSPPPVKNEIP